MRSWLFCCYTWSNWASSPLWRDFDSGLSCDHKKKNYNGQKYSPVLLDLTSTFHWHNNQQGKKYLFEIWHTNITERLLTEIKRRFQNHYYTPQLEARCTMISQFRRLFHCTACYIQNHLTHFHSPYCTLWNLTYSALIYGWKNLVHNLQYKPLPWLLKGLYDTINKKRIITLREEKTL